MATARYFPLASGAPAFSKPLNSRFVASLAMCVAVLSALTAFLFLYERDHSLLSSTSGQEAAPYLVQPAAPGTRMVQADARPAPQTVTRVTVPTSVDRQQPSVAVASQPIGTLPLAQAKSSGSTAAASYPLVAKSHADILALEKRGVQRYFEFTVRPSSRFRRIGPVSVAVTRIDPKRRLYDINVLVDKRRIEKKRVGLYSPILVASTEYSRPLELVVNSLNRRGVSGYLSEPKISH